MTERKLMPGRRRLLRFATAPDHGRCDGEWNSHVRGETEVRRADRNFADLLQETRVLQTGVQVLFALLVTVAFTGRFATSDQFERLVYVATLCAVVAAAALLIAPVAYHRLFFRAGRKRELVDIAHRLVRLGLVALSVALIGSLALVLNVVLTRSVALLLTGVVSAGLISLWFLLPARALRGHRAKYPKPQQSPWQAESPAKCPNGPSRDRHTPSRGRIHR
jgi:hypothetical protein